MILEVFLNTFTDTFMFSSARTFVHSILLKDCSFYQTPTPTAAARNESNYGLITSIEEEDGKD